MKKIVKWIMPVLLMIAGAGCLKMDQTLTINKDGSAMLDMSYGMQESTIAQMEAMEKMSEQMAAQMGEEGEDMGDEDDDSDSFEFNEESIRDDFKDLKQYGVELVDLNSEIKDGWKFINMKVRFQDLKSLAKTDFFKDSDMSLKKNADGNYVLSQKSDDMGMGGDEDDEMTPEMQKMMMQQMLPMLKGMHVSMTIVTPSKILESNAPQIEGNKASWVYDVDTDPSFITEMDKMNMDVVFDGTGLDLPEINP